MAGATFNFKGLLAASDVFPTDNFLVLELKGQQLTVLRIPHAWLQQCHDNRAV